MLQFQVEYRFESKENRDGFYGGIVENSIQKLCLSEKGCLKYDYFLPCNDEKTLFLLEEWETPADQQLHITQPHFALLGDLKAKYGAVTEISKFECTAL